ncbi:MAG: threonylcarbamoyl-AMP synthase [Anaerolineaceae bacterium]|nr:threonylcarbamoyl-AMP synthase [Anaerolineaceae bacterium]
MQILSITDPAALTIAQSVIQSGGLIVIPTDTVYGVSCSPFDEAAIDRLYAAKGRSREKAIQVLVAGWDASAPFIREVTPLAGLLAERFWPGALTLTLPKRAGLPPNISIYDTVGLRMPDHSPLVALLRAVGGALAATSANLSGAASPTNVQMAVDALGDAVQLYLDGGETPGSLSSTVVESHGDTLRILRQGPVSEAQLRDALAGQTFHFASAEK